MRLIRTFLFNIKTVNNWFSVASEWTEVDSISKVCFKWLFYLKNELLFVSLEGFGELRDAGQHLSVGVLKLSPEQPWLNALLMNHSSNELSLTLIISVYFPSLHPSHFCPHLNYSRGHFDPFLFFSNQLILQQMDLIAFIFVLAPSSIDDIAAKPPALRPTADTIWLQRNERRRKPTEVEESETGWRGTGIHDNVVVNLHRYQQHQ